MKKTFIAGCVAATLGIAGFNAFETIENTNLSLQNIEALADGEGDGVTDCKNGCLEKAGICFCYGYHPYEEMKW